MAIYHFHVTQVSRGKGQSAIAAAAYRAGERLQDHYYGEEVSVPLWKRYALSIPEAAKYFGVGEKRLYQIIAENEGADFILEIGSHIKIKRELFGRFLDRATCV